MADLSLQELLQPALLDRLTDDEPDKKVESREGRVITLQKLRTYILRDLTWLLNAVQLSAVQDLSAYPNVERSTVNFGLPGFAGQSVGQVNIRTVEKAIANAITRFEPRLLPDSVKVKVLVDSLRDGAHNVVTLELEAELWAHPIPLHLFMKTELDLELGTARVIEQTEADTKRSERRRR